MNTTTLSDVLSLLSDSNTITILDEEENVLGGYDGKNSISKILMNHLVDSISILPMGKINIYISGKTIA
jgi:hypothetical protein